MRCVPLGASGLQVSRLCLGMMSMGAKRWRPRVLGEEEARPVFRRALELGINYIDTADTYSAGESETLVGKIVREFGRRDEMVIATKVYNPVSFDFKSGQDLASLERARRPNMQGLSRKRIPWSPLARGFLAEAPHAPASSPRRDADPLRRRYYAGAADHAIAAEVGRIADERGVTRAQIAVAWLLSPLAAAGGVTAPIVGPQTAAEIEDLAAGAEFPLTREDVQRLERPYQPKPVMGHL